MDDQEDLGEAVVEDTVSAGALALVGVRKELMEIRELLSAQF